VPFPGWSVLMLTGSLAIDGFGGRPNGEWGEEDMLENAIVSVVRSAWGSGLDEG
jgi:hypothetical protein